MAISLTLPVQGGSQNTWGDLLNTSLTAVQSSLNGSGTGKALVSPDLSALVINGVTTTATADDLNLVSGLSGSGALMQSFVIEDGDGTELSVTNGKEIKFIDGTGININFTDLTTGSDSDPYDLTFELNPDQRLAADTDVYVGNADEHIHFNDGSQHIEFMTGGSEEMRLENDGDLHVDGNVTAYSTTVSDQRLKHDINKIENALDKICQISGYTFTYNENNKESAGVIAQEVEQILPSAVEDKELVFHGQEGVKYKTVQYDQLHGLVIEAIKELKAEVEELRNAITG
jgi:hypothetical protein